MNVLYECSIYYYFFYCNFFQLFYNYMHMYMHMHMQSFFNSRVGQDVATSNDVTDHSSSVLVDAALAVFPFIAPGIYTIYYNCLPFLDMNSHWSNVIATAARIMIYLGADLNFWLELALVIMTPRQASIAIYTFMFRFGLAMFWWALFWFLLNVFIPFPIYYWMYIFLVCVQLFYNCIGLPYNVRQGFNFILYKDSHESKVIKESERKKIISYLETFDNDKIFDEFFTTKKRGEGTGLGLNIVKNIIEKHNGNIKCISNDSNTSFEISLPID